MHWQCCCTERLWAGSRGQRGRQERGWGRVLSPILGLECPFDLADAGRGKRLAHRRVCGAVLGGEGKGGAQQQQQPVPGRIPSLQAAALPCSTQACAGKMTAAHPSKRGSCGSFLPRAGSLGRWGGAATTVQRGMASGPWTAPARLFGQEDAPRLAPSQLLPPPTEKGTASGLGPPPAGGGGGQGILQFEPQPCQPLASVAIQHKAFQSSWPPAQRVEPSCCARPEAP